MTSTDPAPTPASPRFAALDGLRGLAVLLVLLDHASDAELRLFPAANMNRAGKYGVYLFYVLSAFLLTYLPLSRPGELSRVATWLNYAVRRFLRIFPLYAIVLVTLVFLHRLHWVDVATHLSLRDGTRQFWSIPVEVKYYFLLPLLVLAIHGFQSRRWTAGVLSVLGLVAMAGVVFGLEQRYSITPAVFLSINLAPFLFGSAAALLHLALAQRQSAPRWLAPSVETAAIVALVITLVRIPSIYNGLFYFLAPVRKLSYDSPVCGVLWTIMLLGVLHGTGFLRRALAWAPLRYLGLVSYSAYLWHIKFLSDVDDMPIPHPLRLLVFLLLVIGVASVSYFLVERPLSRVRVGGRGVVVVPPTLPAALEVGTDESRSDK